MKSSEVTSLESLVKAQLLDADIAERATKNIDELEDDMRIKLHALITHAVKITILGHKGSVPREAVELLSPSARQLMDILLKQNGTPIDSRELWSLLGLAAEREPFTVLWKLREEVNVQLSAYGGIHDSAVRGRPFYWKPKKF